MGKYLCVDFRYISNTFNNHERTASKIAKALNETSTLENIPQNFAAKKFIEKCFPPPGPPNSTVLIVDLLYENILVDCFCHSFAY